MEINNVNIINNIIDNLCILKEDLYYDIDHQLITIIGYTLNKLNIYYSDIYLYSIIINRINKKIQLGWHSYRYKVYKRKLCYNIIDYIIEKKKINNFDTYLKYKITDYYLY